VSDWPVFSSAQPMQALDLARSAVGRRNEKPSRLTPVEEPQFAARATPLGVGVRLDGSVGFHTNKNNLTSITVRIAIPSETTGSASHHPAVNHVSVRAASSVSNTSHQREQQTYCYLLHLNLLVVENTC
jgi:hypothetical protein